MNLKRCKNGHFYDADKFTTCPHCNPTVSASEVTVAMSPDSMDAGVRAAMGGFDSDGKTVSLQDAVSAAVEQQSTAPADDEKTVGFYASSLGTEPTVGWLTCIEGAHYGTSFPLKSGRNFIGRAPDMDVALTGDKSVSRERHAVIIYEPKAKCFIAQAGDSRELFYLNDNVVLSNERMKNYDILSIGDERLIFLGLCGPEFCWEDHKNNNQ